MVVTGASVMIGIIYGTPIGLGFLGMCGAPEFFLMLVGAVYRRMTYSSAHRHGSKTPGEILSQA